MTGYAVLDFETTGLFPAQDRVIELAVVHVDESGEITGQWDTLVNPQRDLGAQRIHHIQASEVLEAPTFAQIAPKLIELLSGRVLVAHNASFDSRFLYEELERIGYIADLRERCLCTMQLARDFLPGAGRSLADCCAAYDIEIEGAHRASVDAFATAQLLGAYIAHRPMWKAWSDHLASAAADWPQLPDTGVEWMPRGRQPQDPASFLQRISIKLPEYAGPADHVNYLALLDEALIDRRISAHEANSLVELAESHSISRETCERLHAQYFEDLVALAWADGTLTTDEVADLATVGKLLGLPDSVVVAAMQPRAAIQLSPQPPMARFTLQPGDLVVLTGDMRRPREEWIEIIEAHGYQSWTCVTKKVRVVAAADPDSLSGKARKARDYGIPVVDENWLESTLLA
ncbi:MAG TPA: exonuclease domain-containing protein [Galbitalea sp.]|jgi:DNA polymerase-3 subunit epsilon